MHCFQQFCLVSAQSDCIFENKLIFTVHVFAETSLLKPDTSMTEVESHSHFAKIVDCKEHIF